MHIFLQFLFFTFYQEIACLTKSGPTNLFYSIPFYYGGRMQDWNNTLSYYYDKPVQFFWSHNWNIDYRGNLWVVDSNMHSVYYISKETDTLNAIFKVSGLEYKTGAQNGNIAMGTFNSPVSIYIYDNNPNRRWEQDHLRPIIFHDKFFDRNMTEETRALKE